MQTLKINPQAGPPQDLAGWLYRDGMDDPCCCPIVGQGEPLNRANLSALSRAGCDEIWIVRHEPH